MRGIYICVVMVDGGSAVDGANHADLASLLLLLLHSVNDEERWSVAIQLYNEWVEEWWAYWSRSTTEADRNGRMI